MNAVGDTLLGDAETVLRREAEKLLGGSPLDRLLVGWLLPEMCGAETSSVGTGALNRWREAKEGGGPRSYQAVGALALATAAPNTDPACQTAFNEGFDWALGTSPEVDGNPVGLAGDPPAVLAVVAALLRSGDMGRQAAMRSWLASVLDRFGGRLDLWELAQLHVGLQHLGEQRPQRPELAQACCVIRVAIATGNDVVTPTDAREITATVLEHYARVDPIIATFLLASLSRAKSSVVRSIRIDAISVEDVLVSLRNVTRSLRDWTWEQKPRTTRSQARQWHVDHEYHVQNLLWVVLAPLFPDLESEGYSAKVGFTQPRADLVIPSLKLIIEAKFARAADSLKEIQRQLAQDAAMYFPQGGQYERMIAFVWDDAARTEEHATLVQGLEKLERVAGVVVVSRPSKMHQQGRTDPKAPAAVL